MLSTELYAELDSLWTEFWPATDIKPLAVIDFINLVFFIKQLELQEKERQPGSYRKVQESSIFKADQQQFRWSVFQHLDKEELYSLFNRNGGLLEFVKNIPGYKNWSKYDNEDQPIVPVPELLAKTVRLIARMDVMNTASRTEMNNYLLGKKDAASKPRWDALPEVKPIKKTVIKRRPKSKAGSSFVILFIIFLAGFATAYFYFGSRSNEVAIDKIKDTIPTKVDSLLVSEVKNKKGKKGTTKSVGRLVKKEKKQAAKRKTKGSNLVNNKAFVIGKHRTVEVGEK
jgi:hypothetical protein